MLAIWIIKIRKPLRKDYYFSNFIIQIIIFVLNYLYFNKLAEKDKSSRSNFED